MTDTMVTLHCVDVNKKSAFLSFDPSTTFILYDGDKSSCFLRFAGDSEKFRFNRDLDSLLKDIESQIKYIDNNKNID